VRNALAVGEVKKWDTPLGKKRQGAPTFDNNNPSYQIDYYLRATDLEWGILSNGRLWRLVHKDSSYKLEADLRDNAYKAIEASLAPGRANPQSLLAATAHPLLQHLHNINIGTRHSVTVRLRAIQHQAYQPWAIKGLKLLRAWHRAIAYTLQTLFSAETYVYQRPCCSTTPVETDWQALFTGRCSLARRL
jgi:hypothetical protein